MTIQNWRTFVTVCKYNSITLAARHLIVAQPAVSRTIRSIEQYYNITLFERRNNRLYLTEIGKELYKKASEAIHAYDAIEMCILNHDGRAPEIRVGASVMIGNYIVRKTLDEYSRLFPDVNVELLIDLSPLVFRKVLDGSLDFALIEDNISSPEINQTKLPGDRLSFLCDRSHPLAYEGSITTEQLVRFPLYVKEKGSTSRDMLEKALLEKGEKLRPELETNNTDQLLNQLRNTNGIAVVPYLQTRSKANRDLLARLEVSDLKLRRSYYLIYRKNRFIPNNVQKLIDLILQASREINA